MSERSHILCSECETPIFYTEDGEHNCVGCPNDDPDAPDGWRMLSKQDVLDRAGRYL